MLLDDVVRLDRNDPGLFRREDLNVFMNYHHPMVSTNQVNVPVSPEALERGDAYVESTICWFGLV